MRRETTAEWVDEQITAIFRTYSRDEVDRAIPVLLLLMARDFGFENLRPDMQRAIESLARKMGLHEGMNEDDAKVKTVVYVHELHVNEQLLQDIKKVLDTHYAARAEKSAEGFRRVLHSRRPAAPHVAARRPTDDGSIMSAELLRRATGMIRS